MTVTILTGDCREVLATLPDQSVHCCVTSPPYFGLRDYGTGTWAGGAAGCQHRVGGQVQDNMAIGAITTGVRPGVDASRCKDCGAIRTDSQIGLEPTPDAYVDELVAVFREVRRVLRDDGTVWLNLGDSYASSSSGGGAGQSLASLADRYAPNSKPRNPNRQDNGSVQHASKTVPPGLKPKDLIGIPWRVAFALQADGWYLRQDIIWSKPNPMPESVRDRCTKAHEYIFMLSKQARYYFDADAIAEAFADERMGASGVRVGVPEQYADDARGGGDKGLAAFRGSTGRNKRSVWTVATQPYSEAHFATFPPALIEPCIKAGTSEAGCCSSCGAPMVRQTEVAYTNPGNRTTNGPRSVENRAFSPGFAQRLEKQVTTNGWSPSCKCGATIVPCTVLDPFGGAGTTGLVVDRLQRSAILIELNPAYAAMARNRCDDDAPLFNEPPIESAKKLLGVQG